MMHSRQVQNIANEIIDSELTCLFMYYQERPVEIRQDKLKGIEQNIKGASELLKPGLYQLARKRYPESQAQYLQLFHATVKKTLETTLLRRFTQQLVDSGYLNTFKQQAIKTDPGQALWLIQQFNQRLLTQYGKYEAFCLDICGAIETKSQHLKAMMQQVAPPQVTRPARIRPQP